MGQSYCGKGAKQIEKEKRSEQLVCKCGLQKIGIRMCNRTDCDNTMYFIQTNCT